METLIIYDNEGNRFITATGYEKVPQGGINFIEIEIPQGKQIKTIDTSKTPHEVILEDIPKTQEELDRERIEALEQSNAEMMNLIAMQQAPTV